MTEEKGEYNIPQPRLEIIRYAVPKATLCDIQIDGIHICWGVECPWLDNRANVSCIPAGRYLLVHAEFASGHRWAFEGETVSLYRSEKARFACQVHEANYATQLQGCLAPGDFPNGDRAGWGVAASEFAVEKLEDHLAKIAERNAERQRMEVPCIIRWALPPEHAPLAGADIIQQQRRARGMH